MKNKEIYDLVYSKNENYNLPFPDKFIYIDEFIQKNSPSTILEAGCGAGNYLKRYVEQGLNIVGIEISEVCCNKYLSTLPHYNMDVVEYAHTTDIKYDCMYCFDVLEHITKDDIHTFIQSCIKLSDKCLYGIANHPDVQFGIELHPIKEDAYWWVGMLSKYYTTTSVVFYTNNFFIIECCIER